MKYQRCLRVPTRCFAGIAQGLERGLNENHHKATPVIDAGYRGDQSQLMPLLYAGFAFALISNIWNALSAIWCSS